MSDPAGEKRSAALYEAMKAYTAEARRLRQEPPKLNARCMIVAIDRFNKEMAEDDDGEVIEDE